MTRRIEKRIEALEDGHEADLEDLLMADLKAAHGHGDDVDPRLRKQLADGVLEEQLAESIAPGSRL